MGIWLRLLVTAHLLSVAAGLVYRATLYWRIPVARGEPYGLGDLIDGAFGLLVVASGGACVFVAILKSVVPAWRNARHSLVLAGVAAAGVAAYFMAHGRL